MQRLEVSDAVRLIYKSLGVKGLSYTYCTLPVSLTTSCTCGARVGANSKENIDRILHSKVTSFVKIDAVGSVLYIILYTILLNCLSDLTKIPYWCNLRGVVRLVRNV